jgi:hypothetical protein
MGLVGYHNTKDALTLYQLDMWLLGIKTDLNDVHGEKITM